MHFDALVYIGRFQPFHNSHLALLQQALAQAPKVVVVLGSAFSPRSTRNPFNVEERQQLIAASLGADVDRVYFVPMRDYYNGPRWSAAVLQAVTEALPKGVKVGLFGHYKDASSAYLDDFPTWPLVHTDNINGLNAADLRRQWFEDAGAISTFSSQLPPPVRDFLQTFAQTKAFTELLAEYNYLVDYRKAWSVAPYPPVFVTADAVVRCCEHVLLIQRGGLPGRGCWALPGGFLDQREQLAQASIRELMEETKLAVPDSTLHAALCDQALFDHPDRSTRGRTLTQAFYYQLPLSELPTIEAADDAQAARWVPISALKGMESQMFDDHFMILDRFIGLLAC
ncbi:bifunctional nicotinamide-nucleotide adenylyltransferase/Nudix hydroxylase [Chitinimonas sp. BJB300]|uniref:bifunctional nicotinamide-nucleotide adenylyltransferase/Nudix hydroxylase n=1 Tax=Chitinimonas sp. BJB300 TaxID=1559339 RepID=UPI000C116F42|nr:bifunctional nicotinamide-nucleotide adenylyltransferase/Nudix hydroxylase [Chitinimonas sp. BJB300]PHV10495.1 cytidyltransferase-like protein [Chitinimonas sp. BJB300]TSJ89876.1 bifunctional nicotinamide-nucleotide adenylyltransferase/Nudix hydroxylase [Chitinimonas sp. BJB300]